MTKKDDFLIIGITGPFGSGCTTAAKFFERKFKKARVGYIAKKDEIQANIVQWYKSSPEKRSKKEIIKFLRERQFINALEKLNDIPGFYYISMTKIMNHLIIKFYLSTDLDIPEKYKKVKKCLDEWVHSLPKEFSRDKLREIFNYLESFKESKEIDIEKSSAVFEYFNKYLPKMREIFHEKFKDDYYNFFRIMQDIGNNLRKSGNPFGDKINFSNPKFLEILSSEANLFLKHHRAYIQKENPDDTRTYYVIECFRNPLEILYFRKRYYSFYLFSIYCGIEERFKRVKKIYKFSWEEFKNIDKIDEGSDFAIEPFKQNIKQCVNLADIALTNEKEFYHLYEKLLKYFALINFPGCVKPTHMERNMHLAYSMSLNSTCICRQVGAVIVKDEQIIGAGWNDVDPNRIGCMYRLRKDVEEIEDNKSFPICSDEDYEEFKSIIVNYPILEHSFCYKDEWGEFKKKKGIKDEKSYEKCEKLIQNIKTRSLQECRSLHAEENAILQSSFLGGVSLKGATIYTTTFPCELCAKKILRVGIKRIVYCEPYPKSLSMDVFLKEGVKDIIEIIPFEGVKSPSFFRLFKPNLDVKELQKIELLQKEMEGKSEEDENY